MMYSLLISLFLVGILSAVGALFFTLSSDLYDRISPYLLSLSAGAMMGGVFIHLIFRMSSTGYGRLTGLTIIVGIMASLILERLVHWHCHHRESHAHPLPYVLAVGDSLHNVIDGVLIATSYFAGQTAGLAATVAVIVHKIPKEVGDFGVMVEHGFSKLSALVTNVSVTGFMFIGAGFVIIASESVAGAEAVLLPVAAGNFLYIAGSDLIPAFKHDDTWITHLVVFALGASIMYAIPYLKALLT